VSTPVLEVEGLRVEVAGTGEDIVDDISFTIGAGEVLGLVGESGSGKSTVGLSLLGHTRRGARIAAGSVRISGTDVLALSEDELRALRGGVVSYVPQDPASALNPALRIRTQLEEVLAVHNFGGSRVARQARLEEMLAEVLLPSDSVFLGRYPHQLSGGQQQRIGLAMAFACRPRVIVLDEPTTGLDVTTQAHVLATVRELCTAHGVAALYVSHDLAVVATLANRVAVMYAGRIVETGPERVLFRAAGHPYTRRLIEAIPEMSGRHALEGIPGAAPRPGHRPAGCFFEPRCSYSDERCREEMPALEQAGERHVVRCFRHAEVLAGSMRERRPAPELPVPEREVTLVSVRSLNARHGSRQVLFDIDLTVLPRQCVALVGESGSGKTTLARCVAGLHRDFTGELALHGASLPAGARARTRDARRELQYVFQSPYSSLNPRKTIAQIVGQPLGLFFELDQRQTHERIVSTLERVRLSDSVLRRYPHELSGGERQRVAIARALAAEPALLVCDEVTSALDVSVQAAIVTLIAELQREMRLGLLFVTHNLALIRTIADEVVVMSAGRIVERGKVDDVLDAPQEPYTRALLADTPSMESALAATGT
jgi:peptide/nickel transport system ATP-binding protein